MNNQDLPTYAPHKAAEDALYVAGNEYQELVSARRDAMDAATRARRAWSGLFPEQGQRPERFDAWKAAQVWRAETVKALAAAVDVVAAAHHAYGKALEHWATGKQHIQAQRAAQALRYIPTSHEDRWLKDIRHDALVLEGLTQSLVRACDALAAASSEKAWEADARA